MSTCLWLLGWVLCGIVSTIAVCLVDYFIFKRDVIISVDDLFPLLAFIAIGPIAIIICICQLISYLTEKYENIHILEIKQKRNK